MVSSLVQAKWFILGCIIATRAGRYSLGLGGIKLVSHADVKGAGDHSYVLDRGVRVRRNFEVRRKLMRKVKGTGSFSGPSMTAIFAPGGNAGTSVHLKSEGVTNACPSAAYAGGIKKTQSPPKRAAVTATGFMASSLGGCRKFS